MNVAVGCVSGKESNVVGIASSVNCKDRWERESRERQPSES